MALFGSETEKNVKKASAQSEAQWSGAGSIVGMQVWRVEKFKIVPWPQEAYGEFHSGDAYILLWTYKKKGDTDALAWNVHFWLGGECTQDEAGTAAYKTVELDTLLDDAPVQYREVQNHESELFLSYFPDGIRYLEGGVESGFRHVEPEKYRARLLQVKGARNSVFASEVPCKVDSLNSGDCFILDAGMSIFVWKGAKGSNDEVIKASQIANAIRDERAGKPEVTRLDENQEDEVTFWQMLGVDKAPDSIKDAEAGGDDALVRSEKILFRLSDANTGSDAAAEAAAPAPPATSEERIRLKEASDFNAEADAETLRKALKKFFGKDLPAIKKIFTERSREQLHEVARQYGIKFKRLLSDDLKKKCGNDLARFFIALSAKPLEYEAKLLHDSLHKGMKADNSMLAELLCTKTTNEEMEALMSQYENDWSFKLSEDVSNNAGGLFQNDLLALLTALLECKREEGDPEADARALWEAGEGKFFGTDEAKFIDIFAHRTLDHLAKVFEKYRWLDENTRGHSIVDAIRAEESNSKYARALMLLAQLAMKDPSEYYAERLYRSMKGLGTDDTALVHVIVSTTGQGELLDDIKGAFFRKYGGTLTAWIKDDTSGDYRDTLLDFVGREASAEEYAVGPAGGAAPPNLKFTEVAKGKITRDMFKSEDAFIFNSGFEVYVWIGKGASKAERKYGLYYAQEYLKKYKLPVWTPIVRCFEGGENETFATQLDG